MSAYLLNIETSDVIWVRDTFLDGGTCYPEVEVEAGSLGEAFHRANQKVFEGEYGPGDMVPGAHPYYDLGKGREGFSLPFLFLLMAFILQVASLMPF